MNIKKLYITVFILFIIGLFACSFILFPYGYTGTTRKNQENLGCVCHGDTATSSVTVQIIGPDSVATGQTAIYRVKLSHGPAVRGGFNVASQFGRLDTIPGWVTRRDSANGELTHFEPKFFSNDTVSWQFKYTAPNTAMIDTLFATANSTNNDTTSYNDNWNWSPNKNIRVYIPIGIINISSVAAEYSLYQNYPNPFNPVTQVKFSVAKTSEIKIKVFDILGNEIAVLVNNKLSSGTYSIDFDASNLPSGAYLYSLFADNKLIAAKKMLIVK